jgi:hypothetical protein
MPCSIGIHDIESRCLLLLLRYTLIQTSDIVLYFYRPLPEFTCFANLVLRNAFMVQAILFLDSIVVARYIAIFWMKDPENFKDDFWFRFVNYWVVIYR